MMSVNLFLLSSQTASMNNFNLGWYLIYTFPRHEKRVIQQLQENDVESFFPTYKTVRQWHDRKRIIESPLFPSYVFVKLRNIEDFYYGQHISGVANYVRFGKQLARMDQKTIDQISLVARHGEGLWVSEEQFRPGQQVVITKGPLCGLSCEVVHANETRKILVRVDLLQRNILIHFESEYLLSLSNSLSTKTI
jgi:transcriptional antiterminator RfaH